MSGLVESPFAIHAERRDADENSGAPNDTSTQVASSLAHDCDNAGTEISPATPRGSPSIENASEAWV